MRCQHSGVGVLVVVLAGLVAGSCESTAPPPTAPSDPLVVTVSPPIERQVTETEDFTGKTDAIESVEIRARVSGYLTRIFFKDGAEVKKGEPLFEIDPRPYEFTLKNDQGRVAAIEARLIRVNADLTRAKQLLPEKAISGTDYDKTVSDVAEASASLDSAKAAVEQATLNVQFTKIASPIDGRISRTLITVGNLVNADSTLLTTIVSVDPIYAYFDVAENTFQRIQQRIREGKIRQVEPEKVAVFLELSAEEGFPHQGLLDFADNRVDPNTGTLRLRAVFPNPKPASGSRVLVPGMFGRLRIPIGEPRPMLAIPERAVGTDQGQKFVYVVNAKKEVEYRRLTLGKLEGELRAVESGLRPEDLVIVRGIQRVRPGMVVNPKPEEAPPSAPSPAGQEKPAAGKPAEKPQH